MAPFTCSAGLLEVVLQGYFHIPSECTNLMYVRATHKAEKHRKGLKKFSLYFVSIQSALAL